MTVPSRRNAILTLVTACLAVLILPASLTGTSVALPQINAELRPGLVELQWVVNSYNLTFAGFMLAWGSVADIIGRKRVFLVGAALFGACSLVSTLAQDIILLDVVRGLSGVGAAAMLTAGSALIANAYQGPSLSTAFAVFGSAAGAGLAIGPSLSGFLIGAFDWRAVFATHFLVAVVVMVLAVFVAPGPPAAAGARIDRGGTLTFTPALFALVLAVMEGPQLGWDHPFVLALFGATAVLGALFAVAESRTDQPMFDFALFRQPRFFTVSMIPIVLALSFVALLIYLPVYFTAAYGMAAGVVGWTMVIMTVPVVVVPLLAGRLLAAGISAGRLLAVSLGLVAVGTGLLTVIEPGRPVAMLVPALLLIGSGMGLSAGILDGAAVGSVPPDRAGTAAGMFNTMRLAGETIAIAVVGTLLVGFVQDRLRAELGAVAADADPTAVANQVVSGNVNDLPGVPADQLADVLPVLTGAFTTSLHWVLIGMTVIAAAAAVCTLVVLREPGAASPADGPEPSAGGSQDSAVETARVPQLESA